MKLKIKTMELDEITLGFLVPKVPAFKRHRSWPLKTPENVTNELISGLSLLLPLLRSEEGEQETTAGGDDENKKN